MPHRKQTTRKKHKSTLKLKENNSGYDGDNSNSSDSNASANNNNSVKGIHNSNKRSFKNFSSNNKSQTRKYTNMNAHIIASLTYKYNSHLEALKELYRLGNKYKLSQTHMKILEYRLNKMYK